MIGSSSMVVALSLMALLVGPSATAAEHDPPISPSSVVEHRAAAKSYREKAAGARREAELHQTMIDRYLNWPGQKAGVVQDADRWFIEHCRKFVEQANALATTAAALASYHEKQAEKLAKK